MNYKYVERLNRLEHLADRSRDWKRLAVPCVHPVDKSNTCWSISFVSDQLANSRRLQCITVIDTCTRECLANRIALRISTSEVVEVPLQIGADRCLHDRLYLDNLSEVRLQQPES